MGGRPRSAKRTIAIRLNEITYLTQEEYDAAASGATLQNAATIARLAQGDFVQLTAVQTGNTDLAGRSQRRDLPPMAWLGPSAGSVLSRARDRGPRPDPDLERLGLGRQRLGDGARARAHGAGRDRHRGGARAARADPGAGIRGGHVRGRVRRRQGAAVRQRLGRRPDRDPAGDRRLGRRTSSPAPMAPRASIRRWPAAAPGTLALASHVVKASLRLGINASPEPFTEHRRQRRRGLHGGRR